MYKRAFAPSFNKMEYSPLYKIKVSSKNQKLDPFRVKDTTSESRQNETFCLELALV